MTPAAAIEMLDRFLADNGEDAILRRIYGTGANAIQVDVGVRLKESAYSESEIASGIAETDSRIIMSSSEITKAQWPGGELASLTVSVPALPRRNDKLIIGGRIRNVEFVNDYVLAGVLVRLELRTSG